EVGRIHYRTWLAFTARTPDTLKRDDIADRLLLLYLNRIKPYRVVAEREFLAEAEKQRNAWWGDVLKSLNQMVAAIRAGKLSTHSGLRMADWESLGRLAAEVEGVPDLWSEFVKELRQSQSDFLLEDEPIAEAIDKYLSANVINQGRELSTRDLYNELTKALFGDEKPGRDWPKSAVGFGKILSTLRRDLRTRYRVEWTEIFELVTVWSGRKDEGG
ncbi:MAG: hypothetical protein M1358_00860, partial [Chloroflexi bacterium]|nr:hypothetical protein [Chloroflexota bacterium]